MYRDLLERHAALRFLLYLVTIVVVLYTGGLIWSALIHFSGIILLFFLAWVVCFILQPLATFLERRGLPRLLAVALIYFSVLALVLGSIVLAIPVIHTQVQQFANQLSATITPANLARISKQATIWLHRLGLSRADANKLVRQFSDRLPGVASNLGNQSVAMATQLLSVVATLLLDAVLVTILSFYMMLDGDQLVESWVQKLPPSWLADVRLFQQHVEVIFGGFLRAQLIIGATYGLLTGIVLAGLGLGAYAFIFAVVAAILMLIPFIGPFLAVVPPVVLVLLQSPPGDLIRNVIIVVAVLVIAQQITMQLVAPKVMSAHVGLHPLLLFAALLVGAEEGGVWGAVFAGPVAAIVVAMLDVFFVRFQQASPLYPDITFEPASEEEYRAQLEQQRPRQTRAHDQARRDADLTPKAEEEPAGMGEPCAAGKPDASERTAKRQPDQQGGGQAPTTPTSESGATPAGAGKMPVRGQSGPPTPPAASGAPGESNGASTHGDDAPSGQRVGNGHVEGSGRADHPHLWDRLLRR
jgi:predicted PurR-regulated permease PerM